MRGVWMRWPPWRQVLAPDETFTVDGEVVWSWRRDPGVYPLRLCGDGNGDNKGRSPGRARISRQTIARGKPGCLGCTCQTRVRSLSTIAHGNLRAQSAPGFPCALCQRGSDEIAELRRNRAVRTRAHACPRHCEERSDEAIQLAWRSEGKMDCFGEPVIGRAFARPVGSQ